MKYLLLVVMLATIGLLTYRGIVINKREYSKLTRDVVRLHIVAVTTVLVYALTMHRWLSDGSQYIPGLFVFYEKGNLW